MHKQIVGCLAVLLMTATLAQAQDYFGLEDPFAPDWGDSYNEQMDAIEERQRRQRDFSNPFGSVEESDEYRSWDRLRGLERCNALTNNPAARAYCLEGLR